MKVSGAEKGEGLALEESLDDTTTREVMEGCVGHCEMERKKSGYL